MRAMFRGRGCRAALAIALALCGSAGGAQVPDDEAGPRLRALPPGVTVERDVAYGAHPLQRMDVYRPAGTRNGMVILLVHGGAWRFGDKASAAVVENKLAHWAAQGVVLVSVNYRLLPEADPATQADDVARALAAAQARAAAWGADPARFVLMGHSAGAHLVALLAARPARATGQGARPWLGTVVLDSAALDVESLMERRHLRLHDGAFGADRAYWRSVCPEHQLSAGARPLLLVCSTQRGDDSCGAARRFAARAEALKVRATVLPQDLGHGDVNRTLGLPGAYTGAVDAFLASLGT